MLQLQIKKKINSDVVKALSLIFVKDFFSWEGSKRHAKEGVTFKSNLS